MRTRASGLDDWGEGVGVAVLGECACAGEREVGAADHHVLLAPHPDWQGAYDQDGPMAVATRRRLVDRVIADSVGLSLFRVGQADEETDTTQQRTEASTRCAVEFKNRVGFGALGRHCPGRIRT